MKEVIKGASIIIGVVFALVVLIGGLIWASHGEDILWENRTSEGVLVQKVSERMERDSIQFSLTDQACPGDQRIVYNLFFTDAETVTLRCDGGRSVRVKAGLYENHEMTVKSYLELGEAVHPNLDVWQAD